MSLENISFDSEEVMKTNVLRHVLHSNLKSVRVLFSTEALKRAALLSNY
jgi:hypothetical protein